MPKNVHFISIENYSTRNFVFYMNDFIADNKTLADQEWGNELNNFLFAKNTLIPCNGHWIFENIFMFVYKT